MQCHAWQIVQNAVATLCMHATDGKQTLPQHTTTVWGQIKDKNGVL